MKKVTIYCEGGTTWMFNTSDEKYIIDLQNSITDPKGKSEFIVINELNANRQLTIRKSKINIFSVEDML